jgi:hypothetical protein
MAEYLVRPRLVITINLTFAHKNNVNITTHGTVGAAQTTIKVVPDGTHSQKQPTTHIHSHNYEQLAAPCSDIPRARSSFF